MLYSFCILVFILILVKFRIIVFINILNKLLV